MIVKDVELNLNEIEFIVETLKYEVEDREHAKYTDFNYSWRCDDEVKMSNDDIRQIIIKLAGE